MISALVIEDDRALRSVLARLLTNMDLDVREAATLLEGDLALRQDPDVVLLDLGLPDGDGRLILERCRDREPWVPVIVVSGADDLDSTVDAIQRGAYDYLVKPPDLDALSRVVDRALAERRARASLVAPGGEPAPAAGLVGRSPAMHAIYKQIAHVAGTEANVLITGETGVGKELIARAIHGASGRSREPFVAINCATLSAELLASELFGHARGSFTGATSDRAGRFEVVGEGTLFLDEVGELAAELQAKLLRVLQERTFERVGESKSRQFRGRLLAATNRDLSTEIDSGQFRSDLYYRLGVVEIAVPPMRERREDIPVLVQALLPLVAAEAGTRAIAIPDEVMQRLREHAWPGNVRELRNLLLRMTVLAPGTMATPQLLEQTGFRVGPAPSPEQPTRLQSLAEMEADHVARVLHATGWLKKRAAEILGISRPTLDRKIREYDLSKP